MDELESQDSGWDPLGSMEGESPPQHRPRSQSSSPSPSNDPTPHSRRSADWAGEATQPDRDDNKLSGDTNAQNAPRRYRVISGRKTGSILRIDGPQGDHAYYRLPVNSDPSAARAVEQPARAMPSERGSNANLSAPSASAIVMPPAVALSPISDNRKSETQSTSHGQQRAESESTYARVGWWFATLSLLVGGWLIGPALVERFSYAHTRGQMLARYEIAKTALETDPALTLSMTGQWVAQKVRPSVVHIRTIGLERTMGPEGERASLSEGQGSGMIVESDGLILTNEHVVADASEVWVTLSDRREYRAKLVGKDVDTDLALLKIDETGLVPIEWGDEDSAEVGALVWAVGSPFGLEQSTTQGIVSAMHRRKGNGPGQSRHQDLLQSDVAINPGNSGGPLVNSRGQLVGVNTSIVGEAFCGISFAVPSVVAKEVYERLLTDGEVKRGFLGVEPTVVPGHLVKRFAIAGGRGAYVQRVVEQGAAERAGIQAGDIILTWNGAVVENDIILFRLVGLTPVNSQVKVGLLRDGQPIEIVVQIGPRSAS